MNSNDSTLYAFSMGVAIVAALMLLVPVLRRKSDIFTFRNFFLVGVFTFNGRSGIKAAYEDHYLPELNSDDYFWYYVGTIVFYSVTFFAYYFIKFPEKLSGKTMRRWADMTPLMSMLTSLLLMSLIVFIAFPVPIPFIGQVLTNFALAGPAFSLAIATVTWFRNRTNPVLLAMVIMFCLMAVAGAVGAGISRRYLIAALSAVPVGMYWIWLRYKSTPVILTVVAATIALAIPVLAAFTALRFSMYDTQATPLQRAQKILLALPNAIKAGGSSEGFDGQDSVECALSVIHLLKEGHMEEKPFESLLFVVANPIPRAFWANKPSSVGMELPDYFGIPNFEDSGFNLGLNVVGQCYYDGGLYIHVIYGLLLGLTLRYLDGLLVRQPGNPLLIGSLAVMGAQLLGWPRGCIGVVTVQLVVTLLLLALVKETTRLLFGTKIVYPRTDHLVPYPILRSEDDWRRWLGSVTAVTPQHLLRRQITEEDLHND